MSMPTNELMLQRGALLRFVDEKTGKTTQGLFIGPEDNSDFIVVPLSQAMHEKKGGDRLHAHCLIENNMVEFRSNILEVIDDPVLLWRIAAPSAVKKFDLRDHKRIQCSLSASIEAIHKGNIVTGIIRDISKSGARCIFRRIDSEEDPFEMDETIMLRCSFPGIPGEQSVLGKITEIQKTSDELSMGIQFTESVWWVPPYR